MNNSTLPWQEITVTLDGTTPVAVLAAKVGYNIRCRRIRGKGTGVTLTLSSNATDFDQDIVQQDNFDIPGVDIKTQQGHALNIRASGASTEPVTLDVCYDYSSREAAF